MSFEHQKDFFSKLKSIRSIKGLSREFILNTTAGQKLFLYNKKIPRVINISFNEHTCMFACKMCPYSQKDIQDMYKEKSEMDIETLKNIVKNVPNDPFFSFDISSIGETLEFKKIGEFIAYIKQEKPLVKTIISTNALLLTKSMGKSLIESGLDYIQFSLFAGNEEDHMFITESDSYEKVKKNIIQFKELKASMNSRTPLTQTFMIEAIETQAKIESFLEEWSEYVDEAFIRPMYNIGKTIDGLTPPYEESIPSKRYPCIIPWYATSIVSNGDVLGCYSFNWDVNERDEMVIGNINEQTLEEIWQSKKFKKLRKAHIEQKLDNYNVCKNCNLWSAYTNIWTEKEDIYEYDNIKLKDFFVKSNNYRGG
jgi:MoaA/NifB/PqqE/SkfB family radical SAM enzyme